MGRLDCRVRTDVVASTRRHFSRSRPLFPTDLNLVRPLQPQPTVAQASLTSEELEALQTSMSESSKTAAARAPQRLALPVPLIREERVVERARPAALRIGKRWAQRMQRILTRVLGYEVEVGVRGAEASSPEAIVDELPSSWLQGARVDGRPGVLLIAFNGGVVEACAARVLGDTSTAGSGTDVLSAAVLEVFTHTGNLLLGGLRVALDQEQGCMLNVDPGLRSFERCATELRMNQSVVVLTLEVRNAPGGTIRLVAPPETLVIPPRPMQSVPVTMDDVRHILGDVPVELRVDLGEVRMSAKQLCTLVPGAVLPLERLIGEGIPVLVAGKVKAYGTPVAIGDVVAIEILSNRNLETQQK